ncbi:hypothetical protein [Jonesia quinghaiensis]|uniref:hypothetical protein n=1 Tax=Jonesia quinghaiensis TaxID=262806 RepID=UPI00040B1BCD|nr:hypothetical protein [Jonesia quinghaiensis]
MTQHTSPPIDYIGVVKSLNTALEQGKPYLPLELQKQAHQSLRAIDERLALGVHHTIVALAGGTGSGKSSTFNAISGLEFADVGVRRPTTARLASCSWNSTATALLDWLEVDHDRRIFRDTALDGADQRELDGLILLDLPDHDSVAEHHRTIVDKVLPLVDLLIWVVDPQKYADAALHTQYLRKLVGLETSMLVVLNQADKLTAEEQQTISSDLRRLLQSDGLGDVDIRVISARHGAGVDDLKADIQQAVAAQSMASRRLDDELSRIAGMISAYTPTGVVEDLGPTLSGEVDRYAIAAGLATVKETIESTTEHDRATGTPPRLSPPHTSAVENLRLAWLDRITSPLRSGFADAVRDAAGSAEDLHSALVKACDTMEVPWGPVPGARTRRITAMSLIAAGAIFIAGGVLFMVFSPVALGIIGAVLGVILVAAGLFGWYSARKKAQYEARERANAFEEHARTALGAAIISVLFTPVAPILAIHHNIRRATRHVETSTHRVVPTQHASAAPPATPQARLPQRTT